MNPVTLICPQCGAPLPRQAQWRTVVCTYCSAEVTRAAKIVKAASFREAYLRSRATALDGAGGDAVACNGERYRILLPLGHGTSAKVSMAQRLGAMPERVTLKLAHAGSPPGRLRREADILRELQNVSRPGAAYFSQRLPQLAGHGTASANSAIETEALLLRSPVGYWGSLAAVRRNYPAGVDPRHAVWIWRRILEVLGYVHDAGWVHGRLGPEHLLVHPGDHGVLIIGWADARRRDARATPARDLMQAAWAIRGLLHGGEDEPPIGAGLPAPLAVLLKKASEDIAWCARHGAAGIDDALKAAAREAFGAPRFIPFTPTPSPQAKEPYGTR
ncbi:hypothetical protein SAMN05428959_10787 [Duganella sp. CF517]|uniref:serine/threonine protein kinase n=1 Tax=Duganella sp. CF517 TaxID=1881038 RepID=UPI0008B1B24E|nr:serine/threonine-protein kinase [Duganella sp. CF517]SEO37740.1 hypothetical protein SAMN05428959_10787 [Duganella sp. CF517]